MQKCLTTEEFIMKAIKVHNNFYDYSQFTYTLTAGKSTINCPHHGAFQQSANNHLRGAGCPKCAAIKLGKLKAITHEQFIDTLNRKFPNMKFKVLGKYANSVTPILVVDKYGEYLMTPTTLMSGAAPSIATARDKTSNYILRFKEKHGEKYDYTDYIYKGKKGLSTFICRIHGKFDQLSTRHKDGLGCKNCSKELAANIRRDTKDTFISKAHLRYGDEYIYDKVNYISSNINVSIGCRKHGYFSIRPNNLLTGKSCPKCSLQKLSIINGDNATGWGSTSWLKSAEKSAYFESFKVYLVKIGGEEGELFYKIGRTYCSVSRRLADIPYPYEVIHTVSHDDPKIIFDLENHLKRTFKPYKYKPLKPFGGQHECFVLTPELIESVVREMTPPSTNDIIPTSTK